MSGYSWTTAPKCEYCPECCHELDKIEGEQSECHFTINEREKCLVTRMKRIKIFSYKMSIVTFSQKTVRIQCETISYFYVSY
jgi:hypothetical protein